VFGEKKGTAIGKWGKSVERGILQNGNFCRISSAKRASYVAEKKRDGHQRSKRVPSPGLAAFCPDQKSLPVRAPRTGNYGGFVGQFR